MHDFLGLYENAFTEDFCESVVARMDAGFDNKVVINRKASDGADKHQKDDFQILPSQFVDSTFALGQDLQEVFYSTFKEKLNDYIEQFSVLKNYSDLSMYGIKLQKTPIGGGYHLWHCEVGDRATASRMLTYILYLNDVDEGGETELLYYHKRIKPKKGTLVIFPAHFTHAHRGNPPLSNEKYIATGWIEI